MIRILTNLVLIGLMLFGWFLIAIALLDLLLDWLEISEKGKGHHWAILFGFIMSGYQTYRFVYLPVSKFERTQEYVRKWRKIKGKYSPLLSGVYRTTTQIAEVLFYVTIILFPIGGIMHAINQAEYIATILYLFVIFTTVFAASFLNIVKVITVYTVVYYLVTSQYPVTFMLNIAIDSYNYLVEIIKEIISTTAMLAFAILAGAYFFSTKTTYSSSYLGKDINGRSVIQQTVATVCSKDKFVGVLVFMLIISILFIGVWMIKQLIEGSSIFIVPLSIWLIYLDYGATRNNIDAYFISAIIRNHIAKTVKSI